MPILAQMNWTATIRGKVKSAIQSVEKPRLAPAIEYVPMPEGSSSEAPVISTGPRRERKRLNGPTFFSFLLEDAPSACSEGARLSASLFFFLFALAFIAFITYLILIEPAQ